MYTFQYTLSAHFSNFNANINEEYPFVIFKNKKAILETSTFYQTTETMTINCFLLYP
jgi:hypothetical protein